MLKRIIAGTLIASIAITPVCAEWTPLQTQANQIATIARTMNLAEDNPIIKETSRIWWEEQTRVDNEKAEQAEFEASLQGFLNEHYSDAVAMAGIMYAEARGLDEREQSMVCWCILNRWDAGKYGNTLNDVIWSRSQFAHSKKTVSDSGTNLVWIAQDVLQRWYKEKHGYKDVGRTLPQGYCFYYGNGRHNFFRMKNSGAGAYEFGLSNPYEARA